MNETYTYRLEKPSAYTPALIKWVEIKEVKVKKKTSNEIDGTLVGYKNPTFGQKVWAEVTAWDEEGGANSVGTGWMIPGTPPPFLNFEYDFHWTSGLTMYKFQAKVGVELVRFIGRRETDKRDF